MLKLLEWLLGLVTAVITFLMVAALAGTKGTDEP